MELEIMPAEVPDAGGVDQDAVVSMLWREHALRLVRLALVLVGDRESAEDVVRRGRSPPRTWSAESEAMLTTERRAVLAALHRLPRRQREVLVLRYYADLSGDETARTVGVSKGTVKSSASRGLDALERLFEEKRCSASASPTTANRPRRRTCPAVPYPGSTSTRTSATASRCGRAATGRVVSTAGRGVLHGKASWYMAAAAPDNRHFFLTADACGPTVYELVIDGTGRIRSFGPTRIRVPAHMELRGMDATYGGSKLALAIGTCRGYKANELLLADPTTGTAKTWSLGRVRDGYLGTVSISGDGTPYQAFITADGRSLVAYLGNPEHEGARSGPDYGLVRYTLTGRPTATLAHWHKTNLFDVALVQGYGTRWLGYDAGDGHTELYWFAGGKRYVLPQSVPNQDVGSRVFAW